MPERDNIATVVMEVVRATKGESRAETVAAEAGEVCSWPSSIRSLLHYSHVVLASFLACTSWPFCCALALTSLGRNCLRPSSLALCRNPTDPIMPRAALSACD